MSENQESTKQKEAKPRRRPGRETQHQSPQTESYDFYLNFYGSEYIRRKFPKTFNIAEKVAKNWQEEGDFSDIPINAPTMKWALGKGLKRAKGIEKRLDDLGVIPLVKTSVQMVTKRKKH